LLATSSRREEALHARRGDKHAVSEEGGLHYNRGMDLKGEAVSRSITPHIEGDAHERAQGGSHKGFRMGQGKEEKSVEILQKKRYGHFWIGESRL